MTLIVGSERIFMHLERILEERPCNVQLQMDKVWEKDAPHQKELEEIIWSRDIRIVLLDGRELILDCTWAGIEEEERPAVICCLLPRQIKQVEEMGEMKAGSGFNQRIKQYALESAERLVRGSGQLEGGNCFLFWQGAKKIALIGENAISFTLAYLEPRWHMKAVEHRANDITTPEPNAYVRAKSWREKRGHSETITAREMPDLFHAARSWQAKEDIVKEVIKRELDVDDLIVMPQDTFHIDLEMCVHPDGKTIYVNRDGLEKEREGALKDKGFTVIAVNGAKQSNTTCYNYFNGMFLPLKAGGYIYVTSDWEDGDTEAAAALEEFRKSFDPTIEIRPIPSYIRTHGGGIRCLTQLYPATNTDKI